MTAIYLVETNGIERLVKAKTKSAAINHIVKETITARAVTASELLDIMERGLYVEEAGKQKDNIEIFEGPTPVNTIVTEVDPPDTAA